MRLIDSHAHLNLDSYQKDLKEVISRAKAVGVVKALVVGIDKKSGEKALKLKEAYPDWIEVALGFHPHEIKKVKPEDYDWLKEKLSQALALGEIGLDFYKEYSPRTLQYEHLERLLNLAQSQKKPLILHLRGGADFWKEAISLLKPYWDLKMVFHCFTGDWETVKNLLDFRSLVSIPGVVTFAGASSLKEAVKKIPLSRLLLETDCPFLAPEPKRGKRNEPSYLVYVAQAVAELKEVSIEEVAERTTKNFEHFFNLNQFPGGEDEA